MRCELLSFTRNNIYPALVLVLVFVAGAGAGWLMRSAWSPMDGIIPHKKEVHSGQFEFINPLLECEHGGEDIVNELRPFKSQIEKVIDAKIRNREADSISVYFRDLNDGPWFGIGERETFSPASMLKVPVMMSWLKQAETQPEILSKVISYKGENFNLNAVETIKPAVEAQFGKSYTAEELINLMIVYSDNNATVLLNNSGWSFNRDIYRTLGMGSPEFSEDDYAITVKAYASFFRILFNSSYLNREMSNKALDLLASVDFKRGLSAGVPENIKVAHKFGEREAGNLRQFHDCGIVYYESNPYLLCVMTKGGDIEKLITVVSDISRSVYAEVDRQVRLAHPSTN